jgi:hypothetical protein
MCLEKMETTEKNLLINFLDEFADRLGSDGCNDFTLPITPDNLAFAERLNAWAKLENPEDPPTVREYNGKLYTLNWMVVLYLRDMIKNTKPPVARNHKPAFDPPGFDPSCGGFWC